MAITAAELELYRNILEDTLLGDVCTIQTREWTADDMGGGSYTWASAATAVPCRLVPVGLTSREEISGGKITVHDAFELHIHWDRDLDEAMRVIISNGDVFEIAHVDDQHTERLTRSANVVRVG